MNNKLIFIAEAGVNHNGSITLAKKLIDKAKFVGADYIKFQAFNSNEITTEHTGLTPYQKKNSLRSKNQLSMLKKLELSEEKLLLLKRYAKKKGIKFLLSFFDEKSLKFVETLNLDFYKIPSPEITNLLLISKITKIRKKFLISCGMAKYTEIKEIVNLLIKKKIKKENIILLHCNTAYPTPVHDINLKKIEFLRKKFKVEVGFSDHSVGDLAPITAVGLGVKIVEKHFTLNKNFNGPDHKTSMEPKEFKEMIKKANLIRQMLGKENVFITKSEKANIQFVKKYLIAKKDISIGEKFTLKNMTSKRSNKGIASSNFKRILNNKSKFHIKKDESIKI